MDQLDQAPAATAVPTAAAPFVDRRRGGHSAPGMERRQFTNSHHELTPGARELAQAIDEYKLRNRRRFVTYEEIYDVVMALGYRKD